MNHVIYPHPDVNDIGRSLSHPEAITSIVGLENMYLDLAVNISYRILEMRYWTGLGISTLATESSCIAKNEIVSRPGEVY